MFSQLRSKYGQHVVVLIRKLTNSFIKMKQQRQQLKFNHRCKEARVLTDALKMKPLYDTRKAKELARRQSFQNLNLRISMNHEMMKQHLQQIVKISHSLIAVLSESDFAAVIRYAEEHSDNVSVLVEHKLNMKFLAICDVSPNSFTDKSKWVKNLSDRNLSTDEISVLAKGFNFAVTPNFGPVSDIVAAVEAGISRLNG